MQIGGYLVNDKTGEVTAASLEKCKLGKEEQLSEVIILLIKAVKNAVG